MLVFSCGSASLVILALAFNFVLAVHYHGKDMGEQVTDIFVPLGPFYGSKTTSPFTYSGGRAWCDVLPLLDVCWKCPRLTTSR